ncbi:MAG: hypothetical protein ABIP38_14490, partial [Steroidobacteraceae bacterium]
SSQMANATVSSVGASEAQPAREPATQAPVQVIAADTPPVLYATPVDNSAQRISGPLASFVVAHSEVALAGRLLPPSAAMNGSYDITLGTVPMTEAEIGVYR